MRLLDVSCNLKKTMKLIRNWTNFEEKIKEFIEQANSIERSHKTSNNQEDYEQLKADFKSWQNQVVEYLSNSFDEENNEFAQGIRYPETNRYNIGNQQKDIRQLIKEKKEDLVSLKRSLSYYLKILDISDAIVRDNQINIEERKNFDTDEILELLLEKLYKLYDDYYHPVSAILAGNGIELSRYDEERQLAKTLENYGYVKLMHSRSVSAQLTIEGKRYIEKKLKKQTTDYSRIDRSQEELNQKIDEIIDTLKQQNLGQEVLFEELQELKELYSKLNKKNWGQILKGKLVDLGLAQVIDIDVMEAIFKELTDQVLKLK